MVNPRIDRIVTLISFIALLAIVGYTGWRYGLILGGQ